MELVAPLGPVYQAGTLSGNPVPWQPGLATLGKLTAELYSRLEMKGQSAGRRSSPGTAKLWGGGPGEPGRLHAEPLSL